MIMIMSMMMRSRGVGSRGETRQRCRMKTTSHPVNRAQGSFPSVKVSAPTNHCLKILPQNCLKNEVSSHAKRCSTNLL